MNISSWTAQDSFHSDFSLFLISLSDLRLSLSLMLRPTVSRPVCLGIKYPFGAYDQIFITCVTIMVLFLWGVLSDERSGLSFVCAAGPCQRSLSRVRVPRDLRPYFTVSDLRLPSWDSDQSQSQSQSQRYITTDGQPASLSWKKAPIWGLRPDLDYCLTVAGLLVWGALSDERTGVPFAIATGRRQRSHFRVRVL
jgi:hypothetical protein